MYEFIEPHEAHTKHDDLTQTFLHERDDQPSVTMSDGESYYFGFNTVRSSTEVTGELADRIRRALGVDSDVDVMIEEETGDASYSEYTQEQYIDFTVSAGSAVKEFNGYSNFSDMLKWLDKEAPLDTPPSN